VQEELALFSEKPNEDLRSLIIGGKHFFFVKQQDSQEKYRIIGHKIRTALPKEVANLLIAGSKTTSLAIAEGIALSNYQFIHYRKNAESEKNQLSAIDFSAKIAADAIDELSATITALLGKRFGQRTGILFNRNQISGRNRSKRKRS